MHQRPQVDSESIKEDGMNRSSAANGSDISNRWRRTLEGLTRTAPRAETSGGARLALAVAVGLALSSPLVAFASHPVEALEAQLTAAEDSGFSGFVLLVAGGEDVLARGIGPARPGTVVPTTDQTVFDIGSVSKEFTRSLVLELSAHGKLSLDNKLGELLENVPDEKGEITVRQLLDHRSGLDDYIDRPGEDGDFTKLTRDQALERILGQKLLFAPGEGRAYSNSGYTLLAILVEVTTGRPFISELRARLLEPAGMKTTGFYRHGWEPDLVAEGEGMRTFGARNSPAIWPEITWAMIGNGGMVASARDLQAWDQAVVSGKVLAPAARKEILARLRPSTDSSIVAGGNDFGFCTMVVRLTGDRQAYVLGRTGNRPAQELAKNLAAVWDGREITAPKAQLTMSGDEMDENFPPSEMGQRMAQIYRTVTGESDLELSEVLRAMLAPSLLDSHSMEDHEALWQELQLMLSKSTVEGLEKTGPSTGSMVLRGEDGSRVTFTLELEPEEPHRIQSMRVQ